MNHNQVEKDIKKFDYLTNNLASVYSTNFTTKGIQYIIEIQAGIRACKKGNKFHYRKAGNLTFVLSKTSPKLELWENSRSLTLPFMLS